MTDCHHCDAHIQTHLEEAFAPARATYQVEKPAAITNESSDNEKSFHKIWERLNILSLMSMQMTVANNLKATLPKTDSAKEFMKFVETRSQLLISHLLYIDEYLYHYEI